MCSICEHPLRVEIENAILNISMQENGLSIEQIAEHYKLSLDELKMHALFHAPVVGADVFAVEDKPEQRDSLMRKMKLREADMLSTLNNEYLVTLKAMGRRLNRLAQPSSIDVEDEDKQFKFAKLLTKPAVELYLGLGGEIRQNVKVLAEIDRMLNGPQDNPNSGLNALAQAIRGSAPIDG